MMRRRNYLLSPICPANNDGADDDSGGTDDDQGGNGAGSGNGAGGNGGGAGGREFTAPTTQAEFDELVKDRVKRAERKGYDAAAGKYKEKAEKHDALEAELGTETDKKVHAAREEEQKNARATFGTRLVKATFKAEAKGVLTSEQLDGLLEDLDLTKYLDDDGDVDEDKVAQKIKKIAPKGDTQDDRRGNSGGRGLGQGNRPPANVKPGEAGKAAAQKRYGAKQKQDA